MTELLLSVTIVVLISAMCSLFEAVLYSVPLSRIEALGQAGHGSGPVLRRLREQVDRPITAILTLNTIANTGGAAVAGVLAASVWSDQAWLNGFYVFFTLAILVFAEVLPKTAGVIYSRGLARFVAFPLQFLVWVFWPVIRLSRALTFIFPRRQEARQVSEEELITLARLGMRSGDIEADEAMVIQNVLSLESKSAHDIMTPRTVAFTLKASLGVGEARQQGDFLSYSRIPVYDKDFDDVVGIVHRRDVLTDIADDRHETRLEELMKPVNFVLDSISLDRLLRMFLEERQHMFVVLDEFGGLSGLITLEDVLEEILGKEIVDEFDEVTDMRELARRRREEALKASRR